MPYPKVYEAAVVPFCPGGPGLTGPLTSDPVFVGSPSHERLTLLIVTPVGVLISLGALSVVVTAATGFLEGLVPVNDSAL